MRDSIYDFIIIIIIIIVIIYYLMGFDQGLDTE